MKRILLAASALLTSLALQGQALSTSTVLVPDAVFDGVTLAPHRGWVVVVTGNSITYAGPEADAKTPAGATRIDTHGMTLLPGLIDAHVHFFLHP